MMERERSTEGGLLVELLVGTLVCLSPAIAFGRLDSQTMGVGMILASVVVFPAELVRHFGIPQPLRDWWRKATGMLFRANAAGVTTADDLLRATIADLCRATQLDLTRAVSEAAAAFTANFTVTLAEFEKTMTTAAHRFAQESNLMVEVQEELRRQAERHEVMLREAVEGMAARLRVIQNRMMRTGGLDEATRSAATLAAFATLRGSPATEIWRPFTPGLFVPGLFASVIDPRMSGIPHSPRARFVSPFSVWQSPHHFVGVTKFSVAEEEFFASLESHLPQSAFEWEIVQVEPHEGRVRLLMRIRGE